MPGWTRPILAGIFFFDGNPAAVQIEIGEGIVLETAVNVVSNPEGHTIQTCGFKCVTFTRLPKDCEVDFVEIVAGICVLSFKRRQTTQHFYTSGVFERPG